MNFEEENAPVQTYSKEQLRTLYDVSGQTLRKMLNSHITHLEEIGYNRDCKLVFPRIVRYIFETFGYPDYERYRLLFPNKKN